MANTVNVAIIETANTFNHWRIRDNLVANDVNEIARGEFTKLKGSINIAEGTLTLANTSGGVLLSVKDDARVDGTFSVRNIEEDAAGYVYISGGDITMGNRAAGGLFQANINTKFDSANVEFSNSNVFFSNASAAGLVVVRPNTNFLNNVTVSGTMNVVQNAHLTGNTTNVTGNLIVTGQSVNVTNFVYAGTLNATNILTSAGLDVPGQANAAYGQANSARNQANSARDQANTARDQANAAYADSNTRVLKAGDTITGNLTVSASIITQNVVPSTNVIYNLGEPTKRYKDIYLSNSTIYLGDATINATGVGVNVVALNVATSAVIGTVNASTLNATSIEVTSLTVSTPIAAPAESSDASYRLRVGQATRADGFFGVGLGSTANGNAWLRFDTSAGNVWRVTANSTEGTYYTLLTTQNVFDSVVSTSTTGAAAPNSVKTSYDQASAARDQANTARNSANGAYGQANGAYGQANGAYGSANGAYAQANGAYTHANIIYAQANAAYNQANAARSDANATFATINSTFSTLNTSAGTQNTSIGVAYDQANAAYGQANAARGQANTAYGQANDAYGQANTARTVANAAYGQANTATTNAGTAQTTAQNAYGQANTATTNAGNAYGQANTATTNAGNAYNTANNRVATVSGSSGRITSSGTTGITLDLATAGGGAATYSSGISALTVDAYGRVTSVTGSANYITTSGRAFPKRSDGTSIDFIYSAQGGQPTYLWGTNDGVNIYVYNPSNFSVSYSSSSGNADTVDGYHAAAFALLSGATFTGSVYAPSYFYTSDRKLKENIRTIDDALTKVTNLRGVNYNWKTDEAKTEQMGVVAQEVRQFAPEVVSEGPDGMLSVAYGNMIGLLIEAIKEQQKQIDALKAEVNTLKAQ